MGILVSGNTQQLKNNHVIKGKQTMKNVNELRDQLADTFTALSNGDIEAKTAKELANLAGKMINSAKVQLEYHALRSDHDAKITFLHSTDK